MADYKRDDWIPVTPQQVLTPREREVERRLKELEQVVSKVCKSIYTDDTMTLAMPVVTNTTNIAPDRILEMKDQRIIELERANLELREAIGQKNDEIIRLTELVNDRDEKIDELEDKLYEITHIIGV